MVCNKCKGIMPDIQGMVFCPFCKSKIGAPVKSDKYREYYRMHRELINYGKVDHIENAAVAVTKSVFNTKELFRNGKLLSERVDLCGDDRIVEYWNKLCMAMINVILENPQDNLHAPITDE